MNTINPPRNITNYEPPLTLEEGAALLRRSVKTLRRLIQAGTLHAFKIGGRWFLQPSEIHAFIHRQLARSNPRPPC